MNKISIIRDLLHSVDTLPVGSGQDLPEQLDRALLAGVICAEFAAEGTGEDGFFDEVDLLQNPFGGFLSLLLFGEEIVKDTDNFTSPIYLWHIKPIYSSFFALIFPASSIASQSNEYP